MSIKVDIGNQVRQTVLPQWKPLLPLFEAVMNSFQAIKEADLPKNIPGRISIEIERAADLFKDESAPIDSFKVTDNGIGLSEPTREHRAHGLRFQCGRGRRCRARPRREG